MDPLKELKRTVEELAAFNEIGKTLTGTLDIREVLKLIMQKIGELLHPENWSLLLDMKILVRTALGGFLSKNAY